MYSVRDVLLRMKNPQTKLKYFHYLKQRNALDTAIGLIYRRGSLQIVYIY